MPNNPNKPQNEIHPILGARRFHELAEQAIQMRANLIERNQPIINEIRNIDLPKYEIFWGGADIDPSFYNRERSKKCGRSDMDKDLQDRKLMEERIKQGVPIIGICRGAQLLNVVNGGILVQHIHGHALGREHLCTEVATGKVMSVSSTHHQMMVAHQDGEILFKDYNGAEGVHWDNVNEHYTYSYVTEVVYYPKTKSLCIQPHPEWMNQESDFVKWINNFIKQEWNLDPINFTAEEINYLRR